MKILEENSSITALNEMFVNVLPSLPTNIENSMYYPKLRNLLHGEIISFCKEQIELKSDLNMLRLNVGEILSEEFIREYMDELKRKYNSENNNVGIDYHIEQTRIDYGVVVFCIIKRDDIYTKKFVFRFRKTLGKGLANLSNSGIFQENELRESRKKFFNNSAFNGLKSRK